MKILNFVFLFCILTFSINSFAQTWPGMIRVHFKTASSQAIDNVVIRFSSDPSVTTSQSFYWDAQSLNCCTFIASLKANVNFAIQTRPLQFDRDTVRLRVNSTTPGNFKLMFTEFQNFVQAKEIILVDNYTGIQQEVKTNPSYDFAINSNATSQGPERFKLVFVSEQLVLQCPSNIITNHSLGKSGGNVLFSVPVILAKCGQPFINYSHLPGSFFPIGNTTVNINANDQCGNTANCSFIVTVKDIEPPSMSSPLPLFFSCDPGLAVHSFTAIAPPATDNHKLISVKGSRSDGAAMELPYPIGITKITWKAVDSSGNAISLIQTVTVTDNELPQIATPDIEVSTNVYNCYAMVIDHSITVSDNSGNVNYTGIRSDGAALSDPYPVGITTIIWTASDASGNTHSSIQKIVVKDNVPPVIVPAQTDVIIANTSGCKGKILNASFDPGVYDNCSIMSLTNNFNNTNSLNGAELPQGNTQVLWTASDNSGNTTTWLQVIEVAAPYIQVNIPDVSAFSNGVAANTIYLGYTPASVLSYSAQVSGVVNYQWTTSSNLAISGINNGSLVKVTATATSSLPYVLTFEGTNIIGCSITTTKELKVVDIRCAKNKVFICSPISKELCVSTNSLTNYLLNGYTLGSCSGAMKKASMIPSFETGERTLKVFPNPANGIFRLALKNYQHTEVEIRIYDILGKLVTSVRRKILSPNETVSFDMNKNSAGVYNIQVISMEGTRSTKIVIAR